MPISARHLLPIAERRRRPNHRPGGRSGPAAGAWTPPVAPVVEPASPARGLAMAALAVVRVSRGRGPRPRAWDAPAFARDVDLVRTHLGPIRRRQILAASFGREAFHGGPAADAAGLGPVVVAYAIRWLELGDGVRRPGFTAWLAEPAWR